MNKLKIIVFGIITTISLTGCSITGRSASSSITRELKEKWGKDFTVEALGDRWYTDSATAYVYANDDPSMRFSVIVGDDGEVRLDQYSFRLVCRKVEDKINSAFKAEGINSECFVDFNKWDYGVSQTCSIQEYIERSKATDISAAVICEDTGSITGKQLSRVCNAVSSQIDGVEIIFAIHVLSESDYSLLKDYVRREVDYFNIDNLRNNDASDPIRKITIKSEAGVSDKSNTEIDEALSNPVEKRIFA